MKLWKRAVFCGLPETNGMSLAFWDGSMYGLTARYNKAITSRRLTESGQGLAQVLGK